MSDRDDDGDIFDIIDKAAEMYDNNKDTIRDVFKNDDGITIDDKEPLKQALVEDDEVLIAVDVGTDGIEDIRLKMEGSTVKIGIGDKTVKADVPEDVQMDDAEANMNNGILEVTIPREGGDD